MKRSSFDERRDQAIADETTRDYGPCLRCQASTPRSVLSHLAGRCTPCYDAYCGAGSTGGVDGFEQGAPDTADQRDMRRRLKDSRPTGNTPAKVEPEVDTRARDAAKREADRKVADYARRNGLSLNDSATLLEGGRQQSRGQGGHSRADSAAQRARGAEPARFAAEDGR